MTAKAANNGAMSAPETETDVVLKTAEADQALAQARLFNAQAAEAEAKAAIAEFALCKAREEENQRVLSDDHVRVYRFHSGVGAETVKTCVAKLALWDRLDPECAVEIIFNSPGGAVVDGMALFDQIVSFSKRGGGTHPITIGTRGMAASMAGILLQAGDLRWIGKQSILMIHELSAGTGGKIGEMKDDVKFYDAICARVVDIFVERSEGKCSRARFIKGWQRTDWWLLSDAALKMGFVDEVH